jgi:hypothetical protein
MLRWLAVIALFFGLATVHVVCQQQAPAQEHTKTTQANVPPPITENNYDYSKHDQQKTSDVPRWWPEGITAIAIILTMFVIAGQTHYTRRAAEATEAAVASAEKTAKRQLRAYISIENATVRFTNGQPVGFVNFENFGQTPAYETHGWAAIEGGPHPFPIEFPIPKDVPKIKNTIGPGAKFGYPAKHKNKTFSAAELAACQTEVYALYVYGRVDYKDTYGDDWYTNFRFIAGGKAGLRTITENGDIRWMLGPDYEGNDAT